MRCNTVVGDNCDVDDGPVGKARCQKDALNPGHVRKWPKRRAFTLKFAFCDAASEFEGYCSHQDTPAWCLCSLRRMASSSVAKGYCVLHGDDSALR
jgi:hypothetical protein